MLLYRLISWIFIAAVGWVLFFFLYRGAPTALVRDDSEPPSGGDAG